MNSIFNKLVTILTNKILRRDITYQDRISNQIDQFSEPNKLKKLPEIYHYWVRRHLANKLESVFDVNNAGKIYDQHFSKAIANTGNSNILSIGSGDCNVEIGLAKRLIRLGQDNFTIHCTDLSDIRLKRGYKTAESEDLLKYLTFSEVDLNSWKTDLQFSGVMAHHTLHHIVELELLFDTITKLMVDDGVFISMDMIGRNGHMRWPETELWINRLWSFIPEHYKFNHQFQKQHKDFINWDCSTKGFEGIRAEDILKLLTEYFDFTHFLAIGGIIDIFIERGYGHNFLVDDEKDKAFIDFVSEFNDSLISSGVVKPTMMYASMKKKNTVTNELKHYLNWTPEYCIRHI